MNETTDATAIFAPIWRRKWLILIVGLLVAVGAYGYYKGKPSSYSSKTQLYLGGVSEEKDLLNTTLGKTKLSSTEIANQVGLITTTVAEAVRTRLRHEHSGGTAKGKVKAKVQAGSDFITITAEAKSAKASALLANLYAQVYIKRHQANYERSVNAAIESTRRQLRRVEATAATGKSKSGKSTGPSTATTLQVATLNTKLSNLEEDLTIKSIQQISVARPGKAEVIAVSPKKNAIFGFAIGIVLASFVAYVVSRFDGRLRSLGDIDAAFQTSY